VISVKRNLQKKGPHFADNDLHKGVDNHTCVMGFFGMLYFVCQSSK